MSLHRLILPVCTDCRDGAQSEECTTPGCAYRGLIPPARGVDSAVPFDEMVTLAARPLGEVRRRSGSLSTNRPRVVAVAMLAAVGLLPDTDKPKGTPDA
jgi:hypothetical protein